MVDWNWNKDTGFYRGGKLHFIPLFTVERNWVGNFAWW